jgi:arylsulfatase A-like enzyme
MEGGGEGGRDFVFSQIEHACMVRTGHWKLVDHTDDRSELYHLATDPDERENLFGRPEHAEVERDLLLKMMQVLGTHRREGFDRGRNGFFG